jgi:hypothetical protein
MAEDDDTSNSYDENIGKGWQKLVEDVNSSDNYIKLQQLLSRQVRDDVKLRENLRAYVNGIYSNKNGKPKYPDWKIKKTLTEYFYPAILESYSKSMDRLKPLEQLSLRVAADSTIINPPIEQIIADIHKVASESMVIDQPKDDAVGDASAS